MSVIAIIPPRSGSKGLRDKNIKNLDGKPLMAYTIEAAKASGLFDCIHVSTDSKIYADIARKYGAEVPFLRTLELSGDQASSWDTVTYVLDEYEKMNKIFDTVILLQPTSPLRSENDIVNAYQLFITKNARAVVSVCEVDHSPLWADTLPDDGNMNGFVDKKYRDIPRQQMPKYYRVNGAIYICLPETLKSINNLYDIECYAYKMDRKHSIDIDDEMDFVVAEVLMSSSNR